MEGIPMGLYEGKMVHIRYLHDYYLGSVVIVYMFVKHLETEPLGSRIMKVRDHA